MSKRKPAHPVVALCMCTIMTTACAIAQPGTGATPTPHLYALVLDASAFPKDWSLCMGPWPPPDRAAGERGESETLYVQFCHDGEGCRNFGAEQGLFRYEDQARAKTAFERDFSVREFSDLGTSMLAGWTVPDGWTYHSMVADDVKFACARLDMGVVGPPEWRCTSVARYGVYISTLTSVLSPDCMSLGDLARVLEGIDEHMAQYQEKDTY